MKKILSLSFILISLGCGSNPLSFNDVTNISPMDGAGTALSGKFAVIRETTSNSCTLSTLNTPVNGSKTPIDVVLAQKDGAISLINVDAPLYGGVSFKNEFEAGGSALVDRGALHNNILLFVKITGSFSDANTFTASGSERLTGEMESENIDCGFSFNLTGVRKP